MLKCMQVRKRRGSKQTARMRTTEENRLQASKKLRSKEEGYKAAKQTPKSMQIRKEDANKQISIKLTTKTARKQVA